MNIKAPRAFAPLGFFHDLRYAGVGEKIGEKNYRFLAKMLTSLLERTYFSGDIVIFRNSSVSFFMVERKLAT
jgi:hypothetical protein